MKKTIPYGRQHIDDDDIKAVIEVLKADFLTQGPKVLEFEKALSQYCGAKYAIAVSSGTAALHLACLAAGITRNDHVITTPISFVATSNSVLYCGGKASFADIDDITINIDPEQIKKKLTKNTRAIMPVHFGGHPAEMQEIFNIAKSRGLTVIEDACHALGAEYRGTKIGSCKFSDLAVFSFHPLKHITTGEGGAITTNNKKLYEDLMMLRTHGITRDARKIKKNAEPWYYEMQTLGFNYRLTDIQCALGISQLKKLDIFIEKRRELATLYDNYFKDVPAIKTPIELNHVKSSYHLYFIRFTKRVNKKMIAEKLKEKGIATNLHYMPIYRQPYYKNQFNIDPKSFPNSEKFYKEMLTLPLFPGLTKNNISYIVQCVKELI